MLNIALPKGRLGKKVYSLFSEIGYDCEGIFEDNRKLIFENSEKQVRYFLVKPTDVAIYVERGAADIGVAGKDILLETEPDVYELLDLKLGKFLPEYEGQMRLYLRWLNHNDRKSGEESPIGLILCSEGNTEHIEYLMLDDSDIRVAQYFTTLPDVEFLKMKLQRAIKVAQDVLDERKGND